MTPSLQQVAPEQIQKTLNKIWESLETTSTTRACLFNLIFYTQTDTRIPYIQSLAQRIIEKFPSRILFITADKHKNEASLSTQVSILSASKQFDIACDYIQIDATGSSIHTVPFLILPHILPDLPVYLILAQDPCDDDPLLNSLEHLASRLIVDSEKADTLPQFATALLYQHKRLGLDIADLNWARVEEYRQLLSTSFYDPSSLEAIQKTRNVHIRYNAHTTPFFKHTQIQAIYIQAWLSSRLNWEFCHIERDDQEKTLSFTYRGQGGPIDILLSPLDIPELPPGLILSIELTTSHGETFSFEQDLQKMHSVTFHHTTEERCDLPIHYVFPKAERGHSLVKEVCHRGTSEHFLHALQLIEKMQGGDLCSLKN